jgi:translation elongation factor EF-4
LKDIAAVRVGDTIAHTPLAAETKMLEGYKEVRPMVYAGIFPKEGNEYERLRDAIMKLQLSDAALDLRAGAFDCARVWVSLWHVGNASLGNRTRALAS